MVLASLRASHSLQAGEDLEEIEEEDEEFDDEESGRHAHGAWPPAPVGELDTSFVLHPHRPYRGVLSAAACVWRLSVRSEAGANGSIMMGPSSGSCCGRDQCRAAR